MADIEGREWSETSIAGLQVRAEGAAGMRVLGWEGVVPLSVIRTVVTSAASTASPLAAPPVVLPSVRRTPGRRQAQHRHRPRTSPEAQVWDAETVRRILRRRGCPEFSDTEDGFVVDGGQDRAPFLVACTIEHGAAAQRELRRYRQALTGAGMQVRRHSKDRNTLLVRVPVGTA
jgi:hypothetical protein